MNIKEYISTNEKQIFNDLISLIEIPSISSDASHKDDMQKCAERWKELLLSYGADKAEVMHSDGNPLVFAEKHIAKDAKTVLI